MVHAFPVVGPRTSVGLMGVIGQDQGVLQVHIMLLSVRVHTISLKLFITLLNTEVRQTYVYRPLPELRATG